MGYGPPKARQAWPRPATTLVSPCAWARPSHGHGRRMPPWHCLTCARYKGVSTFGPPRKAHQSRKEGIGDTPLFGGRRLYLVACCTRTRRYRTGSARRVDTRSRRPAAALQPRRKTGLLEDYKIRTTTAAVASRQCPDAPSRAESPMGGAGRGATSGGGIRAATRGGSWALGPRPGLRPPAGSCHATTGSTEESQVYRCLSTFLD